MFRAGGFLKGHMVLYGGLRCPSPARDPGRGTQHDDDRAAHVVGRGGVQHGVPNIYIVYSPTRRPMEEPTNADDRLLLYPPTAPQSSSRATALRRQLEPPQRWIDQHPELNLVLNTTLNLRDLGSAYRGDNATSGALGTFIAAIDGGQ